MQGYTAPALTAPQWPQQHPAEAYLEEGEAVIYQALQAKEETELANLEKSASQIITYCSSF